MAKRRTTVPKNVPAMKTAAKRQNQKLYRSLTWVGGALVAIGVIVALVLLVQSNVALAGAPGERIPIQGADHIADGQSHPPYNSDPPTSGPHYINPLDAGFYDTPQLDERLVHNLEHGHIVIAYDCSRLADCETTKQQLRGIFDSYDGWKMVVVPRQNKDAALALTAWGWLDKMDSFDGARIRKFIDAWRDKGPERTIE